MTFSQPFIQAGVQATTVITSFVVITPISSSLCNDAFVATLLRGLITIIGVLRAFGVAIAVHGIVMGGLTRILSFGDARKISQSNRAIIESIVGLIIVLLSIVLGNSIPHWFGLTSHTCPISPENSSIP